MRGALVIKSGSERLDGERVAAILRALPNCHQTLTTDDVYRDLGTRLMIDECTGTETPFDYIVVIGQALPNEATIFGREVIRIN